MNNNTEQIRKKRNNIRGSLKQSLIKCGQIFSHQPLTPSPSLKHESQKNIKQNEQNHKEKEAEKDHSKQKQKSAARIRRKTSLDIRGLGSTFDMFECNEVFIYDQFNQIYDLVKKIDQGADSVVHQAIQKKTGNKFAVKVIKKKDQDIIDGLKTHFRILKNIDHPNVIKAYNLFIDPVYGINYLILEYCQFPNLRFHLLKNRILKETQAAEILTSILSTVSHLHSQGICHRDIKPQNILFDPSTRQIKLIDFQVSKMIKYSHMKLQMMSNTGTLHYKAPEMFSSGLYTQEIDIWAVGVMGYEMLYGDFPFKSWYATETIRQIKETQPKYDESITTDLCTTFLKKCLQKDPLKRFTAQQALKSPFILKYSSIGSSASSPMRRKNSQEYLRNTFGIEVSKCFNEDSGLKNKNSLGIDNGIRVYVRQGDQNDTLKSEGRRASFCIKLESEKEEQIQQKRHQRSQSKNSSEKQNETSDKQ